MAKQVMPVYSIDALRLAATSSKDCVADHFAKYLDDHKNLHFPHKHSFYHLVYFSKGAGNHSIDFVNFPVHAGQIYFMIPGQVHSWNFRTAPDGYIVNFSDQYISALIAKPGYIEQFSFFSGVAEKQVITIPVAERNKIEHSLGTIVSESNSARILKDDFVRTALLQLFIHVSRHTGKDNNDQQPGNYNSVVLRNFQKLIERHYKEKKLTKEYAPMLYITPNHLNALSKDVTGQSAGELIRNRVLLEAKRLLVNAKLTISEIAAELGFIDNSYFSKFFRKYETLTPDAFRKQFNKK